MLIKNCKEIQKKAAHILERKKLYTIHDLAEFSPRQFLDYRKIRDLNLCGNGDCAAICGVLIRLQKKKTNDWRKSYH